MCIIDWIIGFRDRIEEIWYVGYFNEMWGYSYRIYCFCFIGRVSEVYFCWIDFSEGGIFVFYCVD